MVHGITQKPVEVKTIVYGNLAAGVVLKSISTKPFKIEISGDPQVLEKMEAIYTEPINLEGIAKDTTKEVKLEVKEGILASQSTVMVQISVGAVH